MLNFTNEPIRQCVVMADVVKVSVVAPGTLLNLQEDSEQVRERACKWERECVCVRERKRGRERETETEIDRKTRSNNMKRQ